MKLQFNKRDFELLESLSKEDLARTQMFLYKIYIRCSGNTKFREDHSNIVCKMFDLAEIPAKKIAQNENLPSMPNYSAYNRSGETYYTPHLRMWLIEYDLPNDWELPDFSFKSMILSFLP